MASKVPIEIDKCSARAPIIPKAKLTKFEIIARLFRYIGDYEFDSVDFYSKKDLQSLINVMNIVIQSMDSVVDLSGMFKTGIASDFREVIRLFWLPLIKLRMIIVDSLMVVRKQPAEKKDVSEFSSLYRAFVEHKKLYKSLGEVKFVPKDFVECDRKEIQTLSACATLLNSSLTIGGLFLAMTDQTKVISEFRCVLAPFFDIVENLSSVLGKLWNNINSKPDI